MAEETDFEDLLTDATQIHVARDPSFVATFADEAWVMNLGRDIEIAMMVHSPHLQRRLEVEQTPKTSLITYEASPVMTETARIRISPQGAVGMLFGLVVQLIEGDHVKVDGFRTQFAAMVDAGIARRDVRP